MSWAKSKSKRFDDGGNCAPGPGAYDPNHEILKTKTGLAVPKSQRFEDQKFITPGPGQYVVGSEMGTGRKLQRSSSFQINKKPMGDKSSNSSTASLRSEVFLTPQKCTPRKKHRRSLSSGNIKKPKSTLDDYIKEDTVESLKEKNRSLEEQLEEAEKQKELIERLQDQLKEAELQKESVVVACKHEIPTPQKTEALEKTIEQLEKELNECREELKNKEMASSEEKLDPLLDRVETLRFEVELLNQDNATMEEQLIETREERVKMEEELAKMREVRGELEEKFKEEEGRSTFLHFTQEQLNCQVQSLENVVRNLKTENKLLNNAVNKLVGAVQIEKKRLKEVTDAYTRENADSEQDFTKLQDEVESSRAQVSTLKTDLECAKIENLVKSSELENAQQELTGAKTELENNKSELTATKNELATARGDAKAQVVDLRAQLGQAELERGGILEKMSLVLKEKDELERKLSDSAKEKEEVLNDIEVAENDNDVLKDSLVEVEKEKNGLCLDLAEITKQKMALDDDLKNSEEKIQILLKTTSDLRVEVSELEMSKVGLEGEICASREETSQLEVTNCELRDMLNQEGEIRDQTKEVVAKLEELQIIKAEAQAKLEGELVELKAQLDGLGGEKEGWKVEKKEIEEERDQLYEDARINEVNLESLKEEITVIREALEEQNMEKEEVEEVLLDTQGLVQCLEEKLEDVHRQHREEANQLAAKLQEAEQARDQIKNERSSLMEINTDLSAQVTEYLQTVKLLQDREQQLGRQLAVSGIQLKAAQDDGEIDRMRLMQAEDEVLSLQAELDTTLVELEQSCQRTQAATQKSRELEVHLDVTQREHSEVKENLVAQLNTVKSAYNSSVEELADAQGSGKQLLERVVQLEGMLEMAAGTAQEQQLLLQENVKHLEALRDNLEKNLAEKQELLVSVHEEMKGVKEELIKGHGRIEELTKNNLRLKGNLDVRAGEVKQLKEEVGERSKQVEEERQKVEEWKTKDGELTKKIKNLLEEKQDTERIRRKDIEVMVKLREELEQRKEDLEQVKMGMEEIESSKRSMEAQQVVVMEAEKRAAQAEEAVEAWREKMEEMETVMKQMELRLQEVEEEAKYYREQNQLLEDMIEPFKDQLESFENEKRALLSQSEQAQGEVQKLATQYGSLLGHQNQKQKIHHVVKLKQENVSLKSEVVSLKEQITKLKRTITRNEEKMNESIRRFDPSQSFQHSKLGGNKENSMVSSTPLGPPKVRPSRHSTGSPLMQRNKK